MDVGKHEIEKFLNHEPEARDLQNFRNVLKSYPRKNRQTVFQVQSSSLLSLQENLCTIITSCK